MLKSFDKSLERKRVPLEFFDGYYEPKERSPRPQRIWLREKLSKKTLQQILSLQVKDRKKVFS
jgi:hypothetical protein